MLRVFDFPCANRPGKFASGTGFFRSSFLDWIYSANVMICGKMDQLFLKDSWQCVRELHRNFKQVCIRLLYWSIKVSVQLDLKTREIYRLIGKHSPLSLENKLLIYKTVLKSVWTHGIELWGSATKSNIAVIQRYQSKLLRSITNASWYVSNHTLHFDLHILYVRTVFRERTATRRTALDSHPNPLMEPLVHPPNNRRLKRRWTFNEIH
jgi:hypothetical protein